MGDKIKNIFNDIISDKKKLVIFIVGLVFILVIVFILFGNKISFNDNILSKGDNVKFVSEYEELNGVVSEDGKEYPKVNINTDNKFNYTDIDEILRIFDNKGDAVVYFGYSSCLYCRTAIQILYDVSKDTEIDKIYYLDVENKVDGYDKLVNALGKELVTDGLINSPLVIFVADGNVVSYNKGTLFSQNDPYQVLDNSQIKGLSRIYRNGINDVITSIKLKKDNTASDNVNS